MKQPCSGLAILRLACWLALLPAAAAAQDAPTKLHYNRDVRPILAEHCFACHGPDSAARKADLRLDQREAALNSSAFTPGQPEASELVHRITTVDDTLIMPPAETKKTLTAEQKDILQRWIAEGAEYEPHWSLITPTRPALPDVSTANWVRNPIDQFVLAQLESAGLVPAPEADRRTLARRAALDITGLPPTPEQVAAFVADQSPDAYEKYLDSLFDSERWGEHRTRYWLDYCRYADTHGIHIDNFREIWSYRDWLIGAFNRNLPYDQFTIETLAGDLLPNRTLEQQIASGFNRCNITTNEGGAIEEEYLVLYARDRTETVGQVWLGTTVGCAVCHDHKFDAVSQREFYELAAFFNNTTQKGMDGNIKDTPPIITVPTDDDEPRWMELEAIVPPARQAVEDRKTAARADFDTWATTADAAQLAAKLPQDVLAFGAPLNEGDGRVTHVQVAGADREVALPEAAQWTDGVRGKALTPQAGFGEYADVGDFEHNQKLTVAAWINPTASDGSGAICSRLDVSAKFRGWDFWLEARRAGMHIVSEWPGQALKVVGKAQLPANEWTHVAVSYDGSGKAAGVKVYYNGVVQQLNVEQDSLSGSIKTAVPFRIGMRSNESPLTGANLQDLRLYTREIAGMELETLAKQERFLATLAKPAADRTDDEKNPLFDWWLRAFDQPYQDLAAALAALEREQADIRARGTIAHVMNEMDKAANAFVLNRGEYDKRGDEVTPETPAALPAFPADLPRNRLGLAQWLMNAENPLTSRVTVNRFWQEVFGTGIVRTSGDFGVMGELPSHPELLDWLSIEFRESGWDVKGLFRLMLMSATYRQSAAATTEKIERDPANRLLSRGPRFRMDAEMVRDYALAASGLLSDTIGGPSVKPYQPEGIWESIAMDSSNTRFYKEDTGDGLYRRSMYWFWKRMAPPASLDLFNAPTREFCIVRRERTNTPLQALVTLNDEQYVEAAKALAQSAIKNGGSTIDQRTDFIVQRLLSRSLRPEEAEIVTGSFAQLAAYYESHPEDAQQVIGVGEMKVDATINVPELAAWTMLTNELMNLDEVLCK
ncbi:MAG: DUF1553 domain-containing protein [Planctomycetaceae bacterium]|nr:DUF1553 domain-containing protein [Planctomycetaceae bacterium]